MNIVILGHVCIDINSSEHASYVGWGSGLMYMAHYFRSHMDVEPALIAPYGQDFLQYADGVDLLPPPSGEHTLVYMNNTHVEHRTWRCIQTDAANPVPLTPEIHECLAAADIICVAPLLPNLPAAYIREALSHRKAGSITALSSQGYLRTVDKTGNVLPKDFTESAEILPLFDMAILSEDDCTDALQMARGWALSSPSTHIIVTRGAAGATVIRGDQATDVPTDPVPEDQILDSVGCGDVFTASAMQDYFYKKDIVSALAVGNKAARAKLFEAR